MDKLILENFRCFHEHHEIPLHPLTFLVGENSTGKTSLLASIRLAADIASGVGDAGDIDFNEEPFDLGAYDQMASYGGGRAGRSKSFKIGCALSIPKLRKTESSLFDTPDHVRNGNEATVVSTFVSSESQPRLSQTCLSGRGYRFNAERDRSKRKFRLGLLTPSGQQEEISVRTHTSFPMLGLPYLWRYLEYEVGESAEKALSKQDIKIIRDLSILFRRRFQARPYAIAPVRSKPKRTYDPKRDTPVPEGEHVPMVLAGTSRRPEEWNRLRKRLESFGQASGLFKTINVRRRGKSPSDPFQIMVQMSGPRVNLIDVGYGVSQVLPILVDCLQAKRPQLFLMQQPEVHLHPKAQAELGTFLSYLVRNEKKRFVIETHSDYLIDRVRLDIRDKKTDLRASDVGILYFERTDNWVNVHPLRIDETGNVVDAPKGYREFFLDEQRRLFGV